MSTSMLLGMFDWIAEFFKALFDLIPKTIYLLYSSLACVLDVVQLFFRKLAGLDVYYIDGKAVAGDLVTNFISGIIGIRFEGNDTISYSALSTVFWSFIIFGIIICFASTLIAIIKSHYNYDDKAAKGPMQYVYTAGKAIINMAAVPIIVVLGLFVSQAILTALDSITSITSDSIVALYGNDAVKDNLESVATTKSVGQENGEKTYIYYDIFGFACGVHYGPVIHDSVLDYKETALIGASNQTFSGSLFKVAAYNANRARLGQMSKDMDNFTGMDSDLNLFRNAKSDSELAEMIDTAFANNLHIKDGKSVKLNYDFSDGIVSLRYFTNFLSMNMNSFSKFNVGAVWYYYDLWNFNFLVGFGAIVVCLIIFINIIFGLITRLFVCIGLFLVAPPLFGLAPLDGGDAAKNWRKNFLQQVLMAYGAVVGMNIMFLILPYINEIDFFNISIADYLAQTLIIIAGLITIKSFIGTLSGLIGAADANKTGEGVAKEVGSVAGTLVKGGAAVAGGMVAGAKFFGKGTQMVGGAVDALADKAKISRGAKSEAKAQGIKTQDVNALKEHSDAGRIFGRDQADSKFASADASGNKSEQKRLRKEARQELVDAGYTKRQAKMYEQSYAKAKKEGKSVDEVFKSDLRGNIAQQQKTIIQAKQSQVEGKERLAESKANIKSGFKGSIKAAKDFGGKALDITKEFFGGNDLTKTTFEFFKGQADKKKQKKEKDEEAEFRKQSLDVLKNINESINSR